ncbi:indole-3-glycerol phosphate synthase-like [Panicum miliaceum]|uniref:indole-3-glycerol-phosphate synthase n=1 Tax=Panicum miliaceum TaxID=4540 RepID=A0A3L6T657_PANMI|nr:indole-3-glycerol phosphate synthase-like [Panicum miliaceum]
MEASVLAAGVARAGPAVCSPRSSSSWPVARGADAARAVRCNAATEVSAPPPLCALELGPGAEMFFNSAEVVQWESGKSVNAIAAAQGIRVRRRCRPSHPSEGVGADRAVPRSVLEQIVWDKEVEVAQRKAAAPLHWVADSARRAPPPRDFAAALHGARDRNGGVPALIAEVKKASPARGLLRDNFNPVEIAHAYEKNGAACLSILTDEKHFLGSFENLETCPLLCKDFIIDIWQIYYARSKGADAILLIAAVLPDLDIKYMLRVCRSLGMAALVEVHDERELDRVLKIDGVQLIGINNRSLGTFEVDTANTNMLLQKRGDIIKKKKIMVVSESGLFTPDDVAYVQNAGVAAVLVAESLLTQEDPGRAIAGLFGKELLL